MSISKLLLLLLILFSITTFILTTVYMSIISTSISCHLSLRQPKLKWQPILSIPTQLKTNTCQKSIAILISGQTKRFLWNDRTQERLIHPRNKTCPPLIDVYIVLLSGDLAAPWSGSISGIPYENKTTIQSLQKIYRARGATNVYVKFFNEKDMNQMQQSIETLFNHNYQTCFQALVSKFGRSLWIIRLRIFYLHHTAFENVLSMKKGGQYNGYTYWRDDNYFFEPLKEKSFHLNKPKRETRQ